MFTIRTTVELKVSYVSDVGSHRHHRSELRAGHHVGHAIEGIATEAPHGWCVAVGLLAEADLISRIHQDQRFAVGSLRCRLADAKARPLLGKPPSVRAVCELVIDAWQHLAPEDRQLFALDDQFMGVGVALPSLKRFESELAECIRDALTLLWS